MTAVMTLSDSAMRHTPPDATRTLVTGMAKLLTMPGQGWAFAGLFGRVGRRMGHRPSQRAPSTFLLGRDPRRTAITRIFAGAKGVRRVVTRRLGVLSVSLCADSA